MATVISMPLISEADNTGFLNLLAKDIFSRIGHRVQIEKLPGERALINANEGVDDGELLRIKGMGEIYPNLIIVPEPIYTMDFVGFVKPDNVFPVTGWADLETRVVGIINGWKIFETNINNVVERTDVRNIHMLFNLLEKGRADVVMVSRVEGEYISRELGISVKALEPAFARREMYMYLHKRHINLVPKLAIAIKDAKVDGTYSRLYKAMIASLAKKQPESG